MSNTNKRIFLSPPYVGNKELAFVREAFASGYIAPCGPQLDEFERRLAALSGRAHAVALASGTAAIDTVLEYLGVGPGWTVLAPTLSFIATVGPASHRGASIAFVDCDDTGNVDTALVAAALADAELKARSPKGVLVIGVDLYGRCCDYAELDRLCRAAGATFIIDAAESVGSKRGTFAAGGAGLAAIYSFNGNKTVTTSGGGAVLTDCRELADAVRKVSTQSREPVRHYEHRAVGYNYRMSNILAAIGLGQLDRLDEILRRRARTADFYARRYSMLPPVAGENHWINVMLCRDESSRDRLIEALEAANIESRPVWKPLHLQPVFSGLKCFGGAKAEELFRRGICLPSGTGLTPADRRRIAAVIDSVAS